MTLRQLGITQQYLPDGGTYIFHVTCAARVGKLVQRSELHCIPGEAAGLP